MKEKFIRWSENVANHKNALKTLFWVSFAESSISPFPAYFLVLFMLAHKIKYNWKKVAFIATLGSVLGGIIGYFIGFFFFKYIGSSIIDFYNLGNDLINFENKLRGSEFLILLLASMMPIPFKITAIASGLLSVNFLLFLFTSILGRSLKFILVSFFTQKYGVKIKESLQDNILLSLIIFILVCISMFYFLF
ncbi:MAG: VTT domain-containing protein [Candidatus Pacebacteria bacterium]|nr:VTT domain-containing protein [Candidatus Paceibacterota bacterium]